MKKGFVIAAGCLVAAMVWAQTEVRSVNVAGVVRIPANPGALKLVSVALEGFNEPQTLQSLFGDEAVGAENFYNADLFILWDTAEAKYNRFAKYTDGQFYRCNTVEEWEYGSPTNPVIPVGEGLWVRCNPSQANVFTITGQAVDDAQVQINIVSGLQMIGYPYSAPIVLDNTDFADDGATANENFYNADVITFWDGTGYQRYALYTDGKWYGCNTIQEWEEGTKPGSDKVIQVGEGFWYRAQNGFAWTEAIPYNLN